MSLASYWWMRATNRGTIAGPIHLVVDHKRGCSLLACSIFPCVASDVIDAHVQRNFKEPTCERCKSLWGWIETGLLMRRALESFIK